MRLLPRLAASAAAIALVSLATTPASAVPAGPGYQFGSPDSNQSKAFANSLSLYQFQVLFGLQSIFNSILAGKITGQTSIDALNVLNHAEHFSQVHAEGGATLNQFGNSLGAAIATYQRMALFTFALNLTNLAGLSRLSNFRQANALPTQQADSGRIGNGPFGVFASAESYLGGIVDQATPGAQYGGYRVTAGFDYQTDSYGLGVGFTHGDGQADTNRNLGSSDNTDNTVFAFAGYTGHPGLSLKGVVGYTWTDIDTVRNIPVLAAQARGETESDAYFLAAAGSYEAGSFNGWDWGPDASFVYGDGEVDGYTETGAGILNLAIGSQDFETARGRLGFHVSGGGFKDFTPTLGLGVEHEFADDDANVTTAFAAAPGLTFTTPGREADATAGYVNLNVKAHLTGSTEFNFGYDGRVFDHDHKHHSFNAKLRYSW